MTPYWLAALVSGVVVFGCGCFWIGNTKFAFFDRCAEDVTKF